MLLALGGVSIAMATEPSDLRPAIDREHGPMRWVEPATLAAWMADGEPLTLLDVRRPEEFAVSHLRGARQVDPGATPGAPSGRVVVYCSVGYRSGALAARLREQGVHAHNLVGGIFQWANEGREVVRDGRPVRRVHPFDRTWGRLLNAELRAEP